MKKPGRPNQDKLEKKYKIETIILTNYQKKMILKSILFFFTLVFLFFYQSF
jgi:hypothetical protein